MKNLIMSVFAVFLSVFAFDITFADQTMPVVAEVQQINIEPIVWKIRRGENLTRIAERYNLRIKDILEANVGSKCIKTPDKILRGCKLAIPVARMPQVQVYEQKQASVLKKVIDSRAKGEDKANFTVSLFVFAFLASVLLLLIMVAAFNALKKRMKKTENEKTDLSSKLLAVEDKVKKMESVLPGNYIELQTRENGKIKAKIIKVRLGKNGELEVYVACPAEEHCLVNASENLKVENALSHVYKQHGTSQDLKPNGWTE